MKIIFGLLLGVVIGVGSTVAITASTYVAPLYSQAIYDCGIRVSSHASGGAVDGFVVSGAKIGICVDVGSSLTTADNTVEDTP